MFKIRLFAVVAVIGVMMTSQVQAANPFGYFMAMIDSAATKATANAYPTADQAFKDLQGARSFVAFRDFLSIADLHPVSYNYSFRIPYTLNWNDNMTGMSALCVQFVVKYEANYSVKQMETFQLDDSTTANYEYDKALGALVIRKRTWVYYLKTLDGWLYCGAESFFTTNAWQRMFGPFVGPGQGVNEKGQPAVEWKPAAPATE